MNDNDHPLKEAIIDLGTWVDKWRDEPGLETLVDAVREARLLLGGRVAAKSPVEKVAAEIADSAEPMFSGHARCPEFVVIRRHRPPKLQICVSDCVLPFKPGASSCNVPMSQRNRSGRGC